MLLFSKRPLYVHGKRRRPNRHGRFWAEIVVALLLIALSSLGTLYIRGEPLPGLISNADKGTNGAASKDSSSTAGNKATSKKTTQTPAKMAITPANEFGIAASAGLSYASESQLDAYFKLLSTLGVGWVRWELNWSNVQPDSATAYDWRVPDRIVAAAQKYRIASVVTVSYTPEWARTAACAQTSDACSPADPAVFAVFASKAAVRYKDAGVRAWEIWNEPNYKQSWLPAPNAIDYTALLKAAYSAIKQVDSHAVILSGGLAAVGDEQGHIAPVSFMRSLYANGAQKYFNVVAMHPYSYPSLPSSTVSWNYWNSLSPLHTLMADNGDDTKKIWITEFGAPTGGAGKAYVAGTDVAYSHDKDYMTEDAQKQLLDDALTLRKTNAAWLGPFFWYSIQDMTGDNGSPDAFFGLLHVDGSKKPAYDSYQKYIKQ